MKRAEYHEYRLAIHRQMAIVRERRKQRIEVRAVIVVSRIGLFDQDTIRRPVPDSSPRFIGPTKAEWKIRFAGADDLLERALQKLSTRKPIVVIAECFYSMFARHFRLRFTRFRNAKVVEPQIRRQVRLIVMPKHRFRLRSIGPFGKAFSPPFVVFGDWMKLREIKRN